MFSKPASIHISRWFLIAQLCWCPKSMDPVLGMCLKLGEWAELPWFISAQVGFSMILPLIIIINCFFGGICNPHFPSQSKHFFHIASHPKFIIQPRSPSARPLQPSLLRFMLAPPARSVCFPPWRRKSSMRRLQRCERASDVGYESYKDMIWLHGCIMVHHSWWNMANWACWKGVSQHHHYFILFHRLKR